MIVVDTSVWVAFFNARPTPEVQRLRAFLGQQEIVVGDLIMCELLQGFATESQAAMARRAFRSFLFAEMVGHGIAVKAAANYRALRRRGITVRKTIDMLIGTFCIERGYPLLHADRDFDPMAAHLGLLTA